MGEVIQKSSECSFNNENEVVNLNNIKESLKLAETLSRVNLMTSSAAKRRIHAKSLQLKFGHIDEKSGDFVPPKEVLIYLVRMGSISSTPKIENGDCQDNHLVLPQNLNRQELINFCQIQPKSERMVKRKFRRNCEEAMYQPNLHTSLENKPLDSSIRVFQWNILSQALGVMNDHFAKCPPEALQWERRRYQIIEEIAEYNPDIICLQEVDHFNFLKTVLASQGYMGIFFPKPDSPCYYIDGNNGPDGCAIFYRQNKFELLSSDSKVLEIWRIESNQVALLANFRHKFTGKEFCITTTHLKARKGALLATLRNEQGKDLLQFVSQRCENRPVILCGDFNAEPTEPIYSTVINSSLGSAYAESSVQNRDLPSHLKEPAYTTWKIRDEGEICHTIDYIFYSKCNFDVHSVLDFPSGLEIGKDRIPSFKYPSDHFSLCCDLKFKN